MNMDDINSEYINLGLVEKIPHIELFDEVSKVIAEENLEYVNLHSNPTVPKMSFYTKYGKRMFDILVSFIALIITMPINLVLSICTFFDVGRPIVFKQIRVGKDENPFTIVKFRNMTNATDENGNLLPPAQRVTEFGKFVRKTSLDELLNFWSILKGDMSLIGPRPLPFEYQNYYSDRHRKRYAVRPGLECPIIHEISNERITWADQFENDIYYVENVSLLLDLKMMFLLVKMVFSKDSTKIRGNAVRGSFLGYNKDGSSINSQRVNKKYFVAAAHRMGYDEPISTYIK